MREVNLEKLECGNVRATFADGLWDVFIGYLVMQLGVIPLVHGPGLENFWSAAIWLPVCALVYRGILQLKDRIILPRCGRLRLQYSFNSRKSSGRFALAILVLLNLGAGVAAFAAKPGEWILPVCTAVFFWGAFLVAGFVLGIKRLVLYGLSAGAAVLIGEWLHRRYGISHHGLPLALGVCGFLIFLVGMARLAWFIKKHPHRNG